MEKTMSLLITTIGDDAFLALPQDLLEHLGVQEGNLLEVIETKNGIILTPVDSNQER